MTAHGHPEPVDGCWRCATTLEPGEREQTWTCDACGASHTHRCQQQSAAPLVGHGSTAEGRARARALWEAAQAARHDQGKGA